MNRYSCEIPSLGILVSAWCASVVGMPFLVAGTMPLFVPTTEKARWRGLEAVRSEADQSCRKARGTPDRAFMVRSVQIALMRSRYSQFDLDMEQESGAGVRIQERRRMPPVMAYLDSREDIRSAVDDAASFCASGHRLIASECRGMLAGESQAKGCLERCTEARGEEGVKAGGPWARIFYPIARDRCLG